MNVLLLFMIFKEQANMNFIFIYFHIKHVKTVYKCSFMYLPFAFSHLMVLNVLMNLKLANVYKMC